MYKKDGKSGFNSDWGNLYLLHVSIVHKGTNPLLHDKSLDSGTLQ